MTCVPPTVNCVRTQFAREAIHRSVYFPRRPRSWASAASLRPLIRQTPLFYSLARAAVLLVSKQTVFDIETKLG